MNPTGKGNPYCHRQSNCLYSRVLALLVCALALFYGAFPAIAAEPDEPAAKLDRSTLNANQSALLTVKAFGRYAITATSKQGVELQALDRMSGAGPRNGEPGVQDGRLDLFLDRGETKILTRAANNGKVTLAAHAFRELQHPVPLLVEHRLERASLKDFEQRSYWIDIKEKRVVALEAAGRHLADLRLWRDGTWLLDATPKMAPGQANPGQPLLVARLTAELEPGLYLLTAYGGASQVWTEASAETPFLLRFGIPTLAPAMRQRFTMSEFGVDRFLVPKGPNFFRLELPVAQTASLQVDRYVEATPFESGGASATIDKRALPPAVELTSNNENGTRLVSIGMEAGQSYVLQHFASDTTHIQGDGEYWIGTIQAGDLEDSVGTSAILTRTENNRYAYLASQVPELVANTANSTWRRRFNLLDELTLFIKLPQTGKIRVDGSGADARYRFEPLLLSRPADYKSPPWRESGQVFELDAGFYVLNIKPETKGILDLKLSLGGGASADTPMAAATVARFAPVTLEHRSSYTVHLNRQPGVATGVVLRRLPIDLDQALPVSQRPGEALSIPVRVSEHGSVHALTEDGGALDIALDNGKTGSDIEVEAGLYKVLIKGAGKAQNFSLGFRPSRLASATPLPPMPDARLAGLPKFPVVAPDQPRYLHQQRNSGAVQSVRVDKPGLYRFESSGLLDTGGTVRTRINPALFSEAGNGIGRNFLIQRYLREGDYQLSVDTRGETAGHLGIHLAHSEVLDGGELREGQAARAMLPSAHAIAYRFRIAQRGNYHLQTLGLGRKFEIRLEDEGGWPLGDPVRGGDLTQIFETGNYRLLVLPQTAEARVLTRLERIAEPIRHQGHGPHRIALESTIAHTWVETAKDGKGARAKDARPPDQWEFALPAPADVTVTIDNDMEATLIGALDPKRAPLAALDAKRAWRGRLAAGRYLLLAKNSRLNNHVPYSLAVRATQLLAGQSRSVTAPASLMLSVGADGLVELESFGASDVRARLQDSAGEVIAQNDDRSDNWNFQIARRLAPGEYTLLIDPVNAKSAQTTVSMFTPSEITEKPLVLGSNVEIKDAKVHIYPLQLAAERNFLLASAKSSDVVGMALEGEVANASGAGNAWLGLGDTMSKNPTLALPLPAGGERFKSYRLRCWSVSRRSLQVTVRAVAATLPPVAESQWLHGAGIAPVAVDDSLPGVRAAMIALARPGVFRIRGDLAHLQWSNSGARTAQGQRGAVLAASGKYLWLVGEDQKPGETLAAERLRLPTGEQEFLRLDLMAGQTATIDLQPASQGPSLTLARARAGQPGIGLGPNADATPSGLMPGEAVAVAFAGTTAASVWNAQDQGALEVDVRQVPFQQAAPQTLGFGLGDGTLRSRQALPFKLPGGALRIRLALAPMQAAVLMKHGVPQSTHWSGAEPLYEALSTDADQLWLLNADAQAANYSIEIAPESGKTEAAQAMKPGDLLERNLSTAGRLRIPIEIPFGAAKANPAEQYTIRVRGNAQALWQEHGGRVASGANITIRASGVLSLQHQPGTLIAWLEAPAAPKGTQSAENPPTQAANSIFQWFKTVQETSVKPPQVVTLRGKQQALSLNLEKAAMLHIRTSVPVVTQFVVERQMPQTDAHLFGANVNLLVPAGPSRLVLRAVGADSLSGVVTVLATPVIELREGAGPEVLLAPGGARLFGFEIKQRQTIGIGVRASADIVRSVLYDERGVAQAEGVVQMPTLVAGRYYIAIELPPDSAPVRVRPILLGINKPDTRPPLDILRRYVESKDGEALLYIPPAPSVTETPETPGEPQDESEAEAKPEPEPTAEPEPEPEPEPAADPP